MSTLSLPFISLASSTNSSDGNSFSTSSSPVQSMVAAPLRQSKHGTFNNGFYHGGPFEGGLEDELEPEHERRSSSPTPEVRDLDAEKRPTMMGESRREVSSTVDLAGAYDDHSFPSSPSCKNEASGPAIGPSADALLRTSPFLQDLLDRLVRSELALKGLRDLTGKYDALRADVDYLLRVQREREGQARSRPSSALQSQEPTSSLESTTASLNSQDTIRQLQQQVSQLMSHQTGQAPPSRPHSAVPLPAPTPRGRMSIAPDSVARSMSVSPELRFNASPIPNGNLVAPMQPAQLEAGQSPMATMSDWSSNSMPAQAMRWEAIGISPALGRLAASAGFGTTPTKIQAKAIPCALSDNDIVVQAPNTMERLGCFILPAITYLAAPQFPNVANAIQILVVAATVEQASQAQRLFTAMGARASISVTSGVDLTAELANLQTRPPQVLIGTPQRLLDLLALRSLTMHALRMVVIDDADSLVARNLSDFTLSLVRLLPPSAYPTGRQTVIAASSVPHEVLAFASSLGMREPVRVLVRRETAAAGGDVAPSVRGIRHFFLWIAMASKMVAPKQSLAWKMEAIADLCEDANHPHMVVYCNTLDTVEAVTFKLGSRGLEAHSLHDELSAPARAAVLARFRSTNGSSSKKVLVVSDSLSRTMHDLHQVPLVVNFDQPATVDEYVHRVSCSAASGYARPGLAINIVCTHDEIEQIRQTEAYYRIAIKELPPHPSALN